MTPKQIWANLAVSNLDRTTQFYTALGFKPNGTPNNELTSFLFGETNLVIHFFQQDALKAFLKSEIADAQQVNEIVITLAADTKEEVDQWANEVEKAGGTLVSRPEVFGERFYGFIFADPDGHKFNVFNM